MATAKEFVTRFNIGAVWTGQKGVNQATSALHKTANAAQKVNVKIKGMYRSMTGALATYGVASRAVSAFTNVLQKSVAAASEAQQVHDDLGLALDFNGSQ